MSCGVKNWTLPNMIVSLIRSAQYEKTALLRRSPLTDTRDFEMLLCWQRSGLHSYVLCINQLQIYDWSWYWRGQMVRCSSCQHQQGLRIPDCCDVVNAMITRTCSTYYHQVPITSFIATPLFENPCIHLWHLTVLDFCFIGSLLENLIKKNLWLEKEIYILLRIPFSRL